jgi:hypothetical protein
MEAAGVIIDASASAPDTKRSLVFIFFPLCFLGLLPSGDGISGQPNSLPLAAQGVPVQSTL